MLPISFTGMGRHDVENFFAPFRFGVMAGA